MSGLGNISWPIELPVNYLSNTLRLAGQNFARVSYPGSTKELA